MLFLVYVTEVRPFPVSAFADLKPFFLIDSAFVMLVP